MKKKYKGKLLLSDEDAEVVGGFIERNFKNGQIDAHALVESARSKRSEIHHFFEWDNDVASEKWRAHQARMLLCSIVIETEEGEEVRAFHNLKISEDGGEGRTYYALDKARANESLWAQIIQGALREAEAWQKRYRLYAELKPISEAIEKTLKRLRK